MKNKNSPRPSAQLEAAYRKFSAMDGPSVLAALDCAQEGLSSAAAQERLEKYGPNQVRSTKEIPWYVFLGKSFIDEFILVLLFLGVVSLFLGDVLGAGIIFLLAVISAALRFVQDYHAYLASEKLRTMIHSHVDVRRDGQLVKIDLDKVVAGDVVELGSGSIVPADPTCSPRGICSSPSRCLRANPCPWRKRRGAATRKRNRRSWRTSV